MIDSVVKKGIFHRSMPQDYVLAENLGTELAPFPFIAVADGCSAGEHSEIGAMILCRAARAIAKAYVDLAKLNIRESETPLGEELQNNLVKSVIESIKNTSQELDLSLDDMIATLRVAYISDGVLYTIETGDGFSFEVSNSNFLMYQYEYEINAPFYLAYTAFDKVVEYDQIGSNHLRGQLYTSALSRKEEVIYPSHETIYKKIDLAKMPSLLFFGLATDGLASYAMEDGSNLMIAPEAIVGELGRIKQTAGEFLVRRFQRMDKEISLRGFVNQDDIGIAMIDLAAYRNAVAGITEHDL